MPRRCSFCWPTRGRAVCLPMLVFSSLAQLDPGGLDPTVLVAILAGKASGFLLGALFVVATSAPSAPLGVRLRKAAIYGLTCCNSNDLSFGVPIASALLPDYVGVLFIANGLQAVIFNPLAFALLEVGQAKEAAERALQTARADAEQENPTPPFTENSAVGEPVAGRTGGRTASAAADFAGRRALRRAPLGVRARLQRTNLTSVDDVDDASIRRARRAPAPTMESIGRKTALSLATNPVILATVLGLVVGAAAGHTLPVAVVNVLAVPSSAFTFGALFALGMGIYGQLDSMGGRGLLQPAYLVAVKLMCVPLVMHLVVTALHAEQEIVNFAWVYGTIPTSASVSVWARQYATLPSRISGTIIICMLASAPMLFTVSVLLGNTDISVIAEAVAFTDKWVTSASLLAGMALLGALLASRRFRASPWPHSIVAMIELASVATAVLNIGCESPPRSAQLGRVIYFTSAALNTARSFYAVLLAYVMMRTASAGAAGHSARSYSAVVGGARAVWLHALVWTTAAGAVAARTWLSGSVDVPGAVGGMAGCDVRDLSVEAGLHQGITLAEVALVVLFLFRAEQARRGGASVARRGRPSTDGDKRAVSVSMERRQHGAESSRAAAETSLLPADAGAAPAKGRGDALLFHLVCLWALAQSVIRAALLGFLIGGEPLTSGISVQLVFLRTVLASGFGLFVGLLFLVSSEVVSPLTTSMFAACRRCGRETASSMPTMPKTPGMHSPFTSPGDGGGGGGGASPLPAADADDDVSRWMLAVLKRASQSDQNVFRDTAGHGSGFVASDFVSWLVDNLVVEDRLRGAVLGEHMQVAGIIRHVDGEFGFTDGPHEFTLSLTAALAIVADEAMTMPRPSAGSGEVKERTED